MVVGQGGEGPEQHFVLRIKDAALADRVRCILHEETAVDESMELLFEGGWMSASGCGFVAHANPSPLSSVVASTVMFQPQSGLSHLVVKTPACLSPWLQPYVHKF